MEAEAYDQAATVYRDALNLAPENAALQVGLARAYAAQDETDVAVVVLEELFRTVQPPPADAALLAVRLYLKQQEPEKAAASYQQAIALDPELVDPALEAQLTLPATDAAETSQPPTDEGALTFIVAGAEESVEDGAGWIERPALTFDDVGGMTSLKEEIRMKIIYPLTHPELYETYGKRPGGGILMYGPPGCGKTYLARATAGEVEANFLSVGLHDVLDMYIGQSERNLHALFEMARQQAPCVLFFDEVDALGANRADMRYSPGRKIINQFLSELDGFDSANDGVLILAATNAPWHVDPALRRPGRFDRVLFVPPPDATAREAILRIKLADKPTENLAYARLARRTEGFSGADLQGVVDRAVEQKLEDAIRSGQPQPLTTQDLVQAVRGVDPTVQEWFATARNYAIYANQGGVYDDILAYLKIKRR
jgi:SpoVK/Ycf46/Vps4 family AAA+-type ATPase